MLRNVFLVSLLIYAVCAVHLEIRDVDSAEEELEEIPADSMTKQQILNKCSICKNIMKAVKKKLSPNATPDEIKNKLNNTCEKARMLKSKCKNFVEKYLKTLIDELMTDDGPNTICTKVKACKSETPIMEFIFNNF
ncbi:antimicrobial peptide NK-lysin-like [Pseudorasbora parva]|uniref:antimicrobial peptide NK-lysin-like n=1 Tax=Pseudorasbora parva TaxID=51549 RepID=UPI00351F0DB0